MSVSSEFVNKLFAAYVGDSSRAPFEFNQFPEKESMLRNNKEISATNKARDNFLQIALIVHNLPAEKLSEEPAKNLDTRMTSLLRDGASFLLKLESLITGASSSPSWSKLPLQKKVDETRKSIKNLTFYMKSISPLVKTIDKKAEEQISALFSQIIVFAENTISESSQAKTSSSDISELKTKIKQMIAPSKKELDNLSLALNNGIKTKNGIPNVPKGNYGMAFDWFLGRQSFKEAGNHSQKTRELWMTLKDLNKAYPDIEKQVHVLNNFEDYFNNPGKNSLIWSLLQWVYYYNDNPQELEKVLES